jgi:hypothetical protein
VADRPQLAFSLRERHSGLLLGDSLQIHTIELPKYNFSSMAAPAENFASQLDQVARWAYLLACAADQDASVLRERLPEPTFQRAIGVLEMIARTPAQRQQYEDRLKAQRDLSSFARAWREEGRDEERHRQLIAQIRFHQRLLNIPQIADADLPSLSTDDLEAMEAELQAKLLQE